MLFDRPKLKQIILQMCETKGYVNRCQLKADPNELDFHHEETSSQPTHCVHGPRTDQGTRRNKKTGEEREGVGDSKCHF